MDAFFTVIVVSYQAGERLVATLASILTQSEASFRVIVKDAGSADGSVEAAKARFTDPRISWTVSADSGIYDGMNQAITIAEQSTADVPGEKTGDGVVCFLNCGDLFSDEQVLARVREEIEKDRAERAASGDMRPVIYYGDIIERGSGQRVRANPKIDDFTCFRNVPCHQACFYDLSVLERDRFDSRWRVRADYEHFLRCHFGKKTAFRQMDLVVCDYEGGGYSETPEGRQRSATEHREITVMYFSRRQIVLYRLYLILTLQPLREKLSRGRFTAALYHRIRSALLK